MDITGAVEDFSRRNPKAPVLFSQDRAAMTLGISGSLDLQLSYELQLLLSTVVRDMDPQLRLVLDLSAVNYISSTGVGALTNALTEARKRNLAIAFRNIPPQVAKILEVLGLIGFFPVEGPSDRA